MVDLDRLLELLDKADEAAESGCSVTTRAYLKLAHIEILERIDDAKEGSERDRIRAAYLYAERLASQRKSLVQKTAFLERFWIGYDDGQHERTLPSRPNAAYRRGYRYGRADA